MVSDSKKALWLAFVANTLWGTSFLAAQIALRRWDPLASDDLGIRLRAWLHARALLSCFLPRQISFPRISSDLDRRRRSGCDRLRILLSLAVLRASSSFLPACPPSSCLLRRFSFTGIVFSSSARSAIPLADRRSCARDHRACVLTLGLGSIANDPHGALVMKGALFTLCASFMLACSVVITRRFADDLDSVSLTFLVDALRAVDAVCSRRIFRRERHALVFCFEFLERSCVGGGVLRRALHRRMLHALESRDLSRSGFRARTFDVS